MKEKKINASTLNKRIKKVQKDFWDYEDYKSVDEEVKDFYKENHERLKINSLDICENYPIECATFWLELINSSFAVTFVLDVNSLYYHRNEISTTRDAVDLISTVFENSYQYFSFITICHLGKSAIPDLYKHWHYPEKAKEKSDKNEDRPWKIGEATVSGKYWVIHNCPLLHFSKYDLKILKNLRDAQGHRKIAIKNDKVFLLLNNKTEEISKEDIIGIANYLKGVINTCIHFYTSILIRERFWTFLSIFYVNRPEYLLRKTPYHIMGEDKSTENSKSKSKIDLGSLMEPPFTTFLALMFRYVMKDLWVDMKKDVPRLNIYLEKMSLEIIEDQITVLHTNALCDFYNAGITANEILRNFMQPKEELIFVKVTSDTIDDFDAKEMFMDTQRVALKVLRGRENSDPLVFIVLMVSVFSALMNPINRLKKSLKTITKPIIIIEKKQMDQT